MTLRLPPEDDEEGFNIFGNNRIGDTTVTVLKNPSRAATVVVAKDGSGDTDDIGEALLLLDVTGGSVFIKEGTYVIDSAITIPRSNITIEGTGNGSVIEPTMSGTVINAVSRAGIIIRDILINCNTGTNNVAISLDACNRSIISNVRVEGADDRGIQLLSSQCIVEGNVITNSDIGIYVDGTLNRIVHNQILGTNDTDGVRLFTADNTVVAHNHITGYTTGANISDAASDENIILGNTFGTNTTSIADAGTATEIAHNQE